MKESQNSEFKSIWKDEYLKTLCGFANCDGGTLYIGVDDDGLSIGVKNISKLLESLPNKIRTNLNIIPSVDIKEINGKEVIKTTVKPSEVPISYNGKFYIRAGSTTQKISGFELAKFIMKKYKFSWDALTSEAAIEEIDEGTVFRFKKMAKGRLAISETDSVQKILENLELLKEGRLTNAGVLLFGKQPQKYFLGSASRVGRFKTLTEIIDTVEINGNLFNQVEELMKALKKHISVRYEIEGVERKDIWDYPLAALREICVNALVHRDYMSDTDIQIKIYDGYIWFWNPGTLPDGITVEMLKGEHFSKPRNKLIAAVFYYAGLIEKWGTGINRVIELCKNHGLPELRFAEFGDGFSVTLYKNIYDEKYLKGLGLNERQIKAVMYLKDRGIITNKEYQAIAPCSKATASRELSTLVDKKVLIRQGTTGKGTYYTIY